MNDSCGERNSLSDAYIAGLLDGEGTIGMYLNKGSKDARYRTGHKSPSWIRTVNITNTNHALLDEVLQTTGLGIIRAKEDRPLTRKPAYSWAVSSKREIEAFLRRVMPHLYDKREQARTMLLEVNGEIASADAAKFLRLAKRMVS